MTSFCPDPKIEYIRIDSIDLADSTYKISKPLKDDKLKISIQSFGLITPPVLIKTNYKYQVICGHNRLNILKELNESTVASHIISGLDAGKFIRYAVLKNFSGEIGPIGKIKFIQLLKTKFMADENDILATAKALFISEDFFDNSLSGKVFNLPESLLNYIDIKEAGFKTLKNILRLPTEAFLFLSEWVKETGMRLNIFKEIVDLIIDIYRRDKCLEKLTGFDPLLLDNNNVRKDEALYRRIFELRYPEYANIKNKADEIIGNFRKTGFEIDFPFYLERDDIVLTFKIKKRDGIELLKKRLDQVDLNEIKNLLELI
ncbi:MAG: ParB N-terminal domain-containing protein [Spirochaetota bacterium]